MNISHLLFLLKRIRYCPAYVSAFHYGRFSGFLDVYWELNLMSLEVEQRLDALAANALSQSNNREA